MPTLTIRQITEPAPGEPKVLELDGPAGPATEIPWGTGEQRANVHWHAGNLGEADVNLLGPEEGEAALSFLWRHQEIDGTDYARIDGQPIATVDELERRVDQLRRERALVMVTWGEREQVGFVRAWSVTERKRQRGLECELTIQWVESRAFKRSAAAYRPDARAVAADLRAEWDAALDEIARPATTARSTIDSANDGIAGVEDAISRLADVAGEYEGAARAVVHVERGPRRVAKATAETLDAVVDAAAAVAAAVVTPTGEICQTDDPLIQLQTREWRAQLATAARRQRDRAVIERGAFDALAQPDVLTVHECVGGETIFALALYYYGDVSGWRDIAAANELASVQPRDGQRVIIPRRARGTA